MIGSAFLYRHKYVSVLDNYRIDSIYIKNMVRTYPKTIAGVYEVYLNEMSLNPIKLPYSLESDLDIIEIWFDDGRCKIMFDDFSQEILDATYHKKSNEYILNYRGVEHAFEIKASFGGISKVVEMNILIDFNKLGHM